MSTEPSPTGSEPLTFGQRYGIVIIGAFVLLLVSGGLVLGWLVFRKSQELAKQDQAPHAAVTPQPQETAEPGRMQSGTENKAAPPGTPFKHEWEIVRTADPEERRVEALTLLDRFWNAPTWRDKLPFVRDASRVGPLMQAFYENGGKERRLGNLRSASTLRFGPWELEYLVLADETSQVPLEVALVRDTGGLRLDWESYTGSGDLLWQDILKQRPVKPVLVRAFVATDDYHNFEFTDASKFLCLKLASVDFQQTLYAFTEREGPLATRLPLMLSNRKSTPMTLRVAFNEGSESTNCVRLTEVVADRWLLLDEAR